MVLAKNLVGGLVAFGGVVMLVTPGPGIGGIVLGLALMNFPGKFRLERRLITLPGVWQGVNWLRRQAGASPFDPPRGIRGLRRAPRERPEAAP